MFRFIGDFSSFCSDVRSATHRACRASAARRGRWLVPPSPPDVPGTAHHLAPARSVASGARACVAPGWSVSPSTHHLRLRSHGRATSRLQRNCNLASLDASQSEFAKMPTSRSVGYRRPRCDVARRAWRASVCVRVCERERDYDEEYQPRRAEGGRTVTWRRSRSQDRDGGLRP